MPTITEAPARPPAPARTKSALVAVVKTRPDAVLDDYAQVMEQAGYRTALDPRQDTLLKLNLSWRHESAGSGKLNGASCSHPIERVIQ